MSNNEKEIQTFIAYHGEDVNNDLLIDELKHRCSENYLVNKRVSNKSIFIKIIPKDIKTSAFQEPYKCYNNVNNLYVGAYFNVKLNLERHNYLKQYIDKGYYPNNPVVIDTLYSTLGTDEFKILSNYMDFCLVFWDDKEDSLVAAVSEPNNDYTHLYYGYTIINHEMMFSNDKNILNNFCKEIYEMPKNTYMINNKFYTFDGKEIEKKSPQADESLPDILDESIIESINEDTDISNDELITEESHSKNKGDEKKELTNKEIEREVLKTIKDAIEKYNLNDKLEDTLNKKLEEYRSKIQVPTVNIIKLNDIIVGKTSPAFHHEKFNQILSQVQLDEPIMLIGPAGSGKNVVISQVAEALGLHMYYTNNASNEFKLTGFIDAGGNYKETEFYKAFKNGGIFFLDEIDNSDPSSLIVINSALANGYMAFPHETIDRNPNFRIIAAANTWGKGADLEYVGRNALDAATLDRFDNIFFDYDRNLEKALYPNKQILEFMWSFRDAVYQSKIPHIVSTRGIGKVYKKEINGIPVQDILTSNVVKNLNQDDVNTIIGNMHDIDKSNKYYDGIKQLKLRR